MSKVFFISIKPQLDDGSLLTVDQVYGNLGFNTGNLLFTNAVWSQLEYEKAESGFTFDPSYVNDNFDHVVIPAANWMYEKFDFSYLALLVEKLAIPVVFVGLGAQAGIDQKIPAIPGGTVRLIKAVAERSALIGARGNFSAEVLNHYGIQNVEVIGCPSLYLGHTGDLQITKSGIKKIMIGGTRYFISAHDETDSDLTQRKIYQFAFNEKLDINYQSERPEFDYIFSNGEAELSQKTMKKAIKFYGCGDKHELFDYLNKYGYVFTNANEWITAMGNYSFYLGSRIHGVIATLLAGTPACLLAHDSRTAELAKFASIPSFSQKEIGDLTMHSVEHIFNEVDFVESQVAIEKAYSRYRSFLDANALPHKLADLSS
jgi:hypothetical protein